MRKPTFTERMEELYRSAQSIEEDGWQQNLKSFLADELDRVRQAYDAMEDAKEVDSLEDNRPFVTWRGWKMIRNVITDRIEELTGRRDYRAR